MNVVKELVATAKELMSANSQKYRGYTIEKSGINFYVKDPNGHRAFGEVPGSIEIAKKWIDMDLHEKGSKAAGMVAADGYHVVETPRLTFEYRDKPDASYRITEKPVAGYDRISVFVGGFTPFALQAFNVPPMMNSFARIMLGGVTAYRAHTQIETAMRNFVVDNLEDLGMVGNPYAAIAKCVRKSMVDTNPVKTASEWLTVDQVRGICAACADKMVKQGISRVKASVFQASRQTIAIFPGENPKYPFMFWYLENGTVWYTSGGNQKVNEGTLEEFIEKVKAGRSRAKFVENGVVVSHPPRIASEVTAKYPKTAPDAQQKKLWREQGEKRRRHEGIRPRK